jgi:hypothetical protein
MPDDATREKPRQADIIFRIENNVIKYQINLYNHVFNKNTTIVKARRDPMKSLAEFLIINQDKFLQSPDIITADENLRSLKQKDFLKFHNQKFPKEKKDSGWSTKVIDEKYIKAPNIFKLIPASHFFDKMWEKVMILKKAIEYHLCNKSQVPLSASDQSKILSCFLNQDYPESEVSRTLWPRLRLYYDKSDWERIRLEGGKASKYGNDNSYLQKIVKNVSLHMGKPIKQTISL